jgi:hypothetical protein
MKTANSIITASESVWPVAAASCSMKLWRTVTKTVFILVAFVVASITHAADVNIPSGLTGLWRFQNATNLGAATVGSDIMFSNAVYGSQWSGPWTDIGGDGWLTRYSDGNQFQEQSWNYLAINPNFTTKGGGAKVNQYTVAIDYRGDAGLNSIFQTARNGNSTDGDLWIDGTTYSSATIGVDAVGFSSLTFDASKFHRIVWSINNGNWFRVYVDGTNYIDAAGQEVDGRFSVDPDRINLFADDSWQDPWGMVATVMTWNRALTPAEVAGMGGWIGGAGSPTPLVYTNTPEVVSVSPANGETNASPAFAYQALIFDPVEIVDTNSVQLLLDGAALTPVVTRSAGSVFVTFSAGGVLQNSSTHKYTLIAAANSIYATNEVTFTVAAKTYSMYEWRFTAGDLSPALGNGVMSYADGSTTPGLTSFGTTDGSTVPHINGISAKYMHVPAFTLETDGYQLEFTDSGPNGGAPSINRYTILMDVMVPGPLDWTAFFNTNPWDVLGNDADFYMADDGSVGIGGIYSGAGAVTANTWCRIAFVADLPTMSYYVNGVRVATGSQTGSGLDGRWALYSNQDSGPDLFLFNEGDTSGVYTHELYVSSVAFIDRVLSSAELGGLGGPSANGIFVPNFAPAPKLKIQSSGGGVAVSWPTNYIGYALLQSDSLTAPQWAPVAGVTNNSVNISPGAAVKFLRLIQ